MGNLEFAQSEVKEATLEAVIIRADGSKEDLGVIAEYKKEDLAENSDGSSSN